MRTSQTQAVSGFLVIDKPVGITSAAALRRIKHQLGVSKIGHAGTLDPTASGLLVVLLGRATRLSDLVMGGQKRYQGRIRFGLTTTTDDWEGDTVSESTERPTLASIQQQLQKFIGQIEQVPPQVSAVKVSGQRAYRLARAGKEVQLSSRSVSVDSFDVSLAKGTEAVVDEVAFEVECSKGTYIRSLARDLGEALGCGGILASLRRTLSAPFSIADAVELDSVELEQVINWDAVFSKALRLKLDSHLVERLAHGDYQSILTAFELESHWPDEGFAVLEHEEQPVGLLQKKEKGWRIVFSTV